MSETRPMRGVAKMGRRTNLIPIDWHISKNEAKCIWCGKTYILEDETEDITYSRVLLEHDKTCKVPLFIEITYTVLDQ